MNMILNVIVNRPYYLWKYTYQTIIFLINQVLLSLQNLTQKNFKIGTHPRVLSFNAFKAEKPDACIHVGNSLILYRNCDILASGCGEIIIGNECIIGSNFRMYCRQRIVVGNNVLISWNVLIADYDAHSIDPDERLREINYLQDTISPNIFRNIQHRLEKEYRPDYKSNPVIIGNNVWIGAHSIILKGVNVGSDSVIAAGSVVTKDIPDHCVAAGNPAKVVRTITKVNNPEA